MSRFALIVIGLSLVACGDDGGRRPARDSGVPTDTGTQDGAVPVDTGNAMTCTPNEFACAGNVYYQCGADGMSRLNEQVCDAACSPTMGCVACTSGSRRCEGDVSMVCNRSGTGYVAARDCAESGATCGGNGYCADACGQAESSKSNIGCEYWPVPLPNSGGFEDRYDFRVVIANPNTDAANVRIFRGASMISSTSVPAGGLQDVVLPWVDGQSEPPGGPTWSSFVVADGAFRLVSDLPVTVSQFNPFEYDNGRRVPDPGNIFGTIPDYSYTNDASLLLPSHSFTGDYIVSSYTTTSALRDERGRLGHPKSPGYISIVGTTVEPTEVAVNVTSPIVADTAGRFGAAPRGTTVRFSLARGEVATIFAAVPPDCGSGRPGFVTEVIDTFLTLGYCNETEFDLTGSRVVASNPVAVFGAHQCAYVPYNAQACDHLENQMPPLQTWGTSYVSAPMVDQGSSGVNVVRVMAAFEDTAVTVSPPQDGVSNFTLGVGQWREFRASSAFEVTGSRGILVTQFLVGQYEPTPPEDRGDPAMVVLPPSEQFRSDYTFVTPTSYNTGTMGQSYVLIIRDPGQNITLDGSAVGGSFQGIGTKEWAIVPINGGTHSMESTAPFGVFVYGMGQFTSYAYPAGLNLEEILLI